MNERVVELPYGTQHDVRLPARVAQQELVRFARVREAGHVNAASPCGQLQCAGIGGDGAVCSETLLF